MENIIKGLALPPPPVISLLKQKKCDAPQNEETARFKSKRPHISFNRLEQVLGFPPWGYIVWKIGVTELNEILLNSMPTSWSKQAYVQGFDGESILLKKEVKKFERMEIAESIY